MSLEELYAEFVNNSIDALTCEANKFDSNSPKINKLIYKIAEKVDKFYQFSHKSYKIKKCLARSWFYRGVALRKMSNNYL